MSTLTTPGRDLLRSWMNSRPDERRAAMTLLTEAEAEELLYDWPAYARPEQLAPPGDWQGWLIMAGRGFGKTRAGAEWTRESAKHFRLVNIIGATADDARDIMIEGESGTSRHLSDR